MIPISYLQAWSIQAPWPDSRQVKQDLIISRALCDLFNAPALRGKITFRGGTAINKLLFKQPLRYSEDIDLVQTQTEPIGNTVDAIREVLSWLGKCSREQAGHSMHLVFKFNPEVDPQTTLKLKVEINTREHTHLLGIKPYLFTVNSEWYRGKAETPLHGSKDKLMALIANIRAALAHVRVAAEQLPKIDRWQTFVDYVVAKILRPLMPWQPHQPLNASG